MGASAARGARSTIQGSGQSRPDLGLDTGQNVVKSSRAGRLGVTAPHQLHTVIPATAKLEPGRKVGGDFKPFVAQFFDHIRLVCQNRDRDVLNIRKNPNQAPDLPRNPNGVSRSRAVADDFEGTVRTDGAVLEQEALEGDGVSGRRPHETRGRVLARYRPKPERRIKAPLEKRPVEGVRADPEAQPTASGRHHQGDRRAGGWRRGAQVGSMRNERRTQRGGAQT